ncbi:MAG: hypothetical protein KZQ74_03685 [gamma proteobacterium symbiont of Bathyaustriella thionipta]|nr:hypothetical protein [gamma proteobacterium symbiont of Bathyaustriella thionipta]MCU7951689.1 hypothetical protein [gamma proteobacterium symbiont of Bathyaustriella thionipta]MCU7958288.1 hypothetical protein [gamma proteobacterium symbiont of Bathyaustriella thionipta]MCU7966288.1 hypothetical protein [gamma proteobacterium symbiont of Bathyaustriella thionipta]
MPDLDPGYHKNKTLQSRKKAQQLISQKNNSLNIFELLYCKKYPTSAQNFLSYSQFSKEKISEHLKKITIKKSLILGTKDKIINQQWNMGLSQYNIDIIVIDGADHFFDYEYEFDLFDSVENILLNGSDQ